MPSQSDRAAPNMQPVSLQRKGSRGVSAASPIIPGESLATADMEMALLATGLNSQVGSRRCYTLLQENGKTQRNKAKMSLDRRQLALFSPIHTSNLCTEAYSNFFIQEKNSLNLFSQLELLHSFHQLGVQLQIRK